MADNVSVLSSFPSDTPLDTAQSRHDYDRRARSFVQNVTKLSKNVLVKCYGTPDDPLEVLDPSIHSLAWLYVLLAYAGSSTELPKSPKGVPDAFRPHEPLWEKTALFLTTFDPVQVRYAGSEWRRLLEFFERVSRLLGALNAAVVPIRTAILRLDPSAGTFTSNHLIFVRLCLQARTYVHALPVLDQIIHSFPTKPPRDVEPVLPSAVHHDSSGFITTRSGLSDRLHASHVHEYFLLGGMVYIGLQRYREAKMFLEHVFSAPSPGVVNGLMLEAYRKWVLVGCLVEGGPLSPPRTVSNPVQKTLSSASKPYEALAEVFQAGDMRRLQAEIEVGSVWWQQDGNEGLVQLLTRHLPRFHIVNLQKTYAAMPISHVASLLGRSSDDTVRYLTGLAESGYLNADIEHSAASGEPAVLRFYPDRTTGPMSKAGEQQHQELLEQTDRTNALARFVKTADHRASLTKEHLDYMRAKIRRGDGAGTTDDPMDTSWEAMDQPDEDMMADLR